jgi:hypothetical protein|tara:strand:- start:1005 stop:1250 length:246 start_codon:yes stop_codon:yes gene_type:complete
VDALPSSWFAAEHSALLVSYCNHVTRAAQIEAGANLDPLADLNKFVKLASWLLVNQPRSPWTPDSPYLNTSGIITIKLADI